MMAAASLDFAGLAEALRGVTVEVMGEGATLGSGVLWPRGCVVTNAHVVRRPRVAIRSADGGRLETRLVASDRQADLAVLRLVGGNPATAVLAPAAARVGSLVVAVGHPFGIRGALTAGIVHAIGPIERGGPSWIQAHVRLGPGNSGGPLADVSGAVVGLNAMVAGRLALAVPMARVIDFVRAAGLVPP